MPLAGGLGWRASLRQRHGSALGGPGDLARETFLAQRPAAIRRMPQRLHEPIVELAAEQGAVLFLPFLVAPAQPLELGMGTGQ